MLHFALEAIRVRNLFYKESYQKLLLALSVSFIGILLLCGFLVYQNTEMPRPVYFATNQDGSLKTFIPLYLPYVDDQTVLDFTKQAVAWSFAYDFLNYRTSLQQVRPRYTPQGYQNFINALEKSANLQTVLEKKFAVTAVFTNEPQIVAQGVLPDTQTYAWRVEVPVKIRYVNSLETKEQNVVATVVVTRVSSLINEQSIAVASLIATDVVLPQSD